MEKVLIVAEKPTAGKDIARILGVSESKNGYMENDKYIVTWAVGHLVGLKDPEEVDEKYKKWKVEDLPLPYDNGLKVLESAASQFKIVKSLIQRDDISYLINAGDAGREGLLIQSWIYRMCGNKHPVKILWSSSLTDEAIKTAMNRLHDDEEQEFTDLFREAETRAVADQIYGYNYTRALTCLYSSPGTVLSYGRCQTPLLNLIYIRDIEIEKFVSKPFWQLIAEFDKSFTAYEVNEGKNIKYTQKNDAEAVITNCGREGIVKKCMKEEKVQKAPALFNLAEIQGTMGKKYGLKPDETLAIAQKLYETYKILSYPRTDSRYLSNDLYEEISEHVKSCSFGKFQKYIEQIDFSAFPMDKAYFNDNKVSDHHALIPTINSSIEEIYNKQLTDMERNFFDEIACSLISIFYPPYRYESTEISIECGDRTFSANGITIKELGYKSVNEILTAEKMEKKEEDEQPLPELKEGQILTVTNLEMKEGKTKPPARYNPGNIIKLMNKYRIGTSATSANIIQILEKRKFIFLDKKNKYVTTDLGRKFISCVPDVLKSKDLTIDFEDRLSKVNSGEITKEQFLQNIIEQIKINIDKFKQEAPENKVVNAESIGKCPICNKDMLQSQKSWYCAGYAAEPKCSFTIWKNICGKTISDSEARKLLTTGKSGLIKGFKSKQGKTFNAYLVIKSDYTIGFEFEKKNSKGRR